MIALQHTDALIASLFNNSKLCATSLQVAPLFELIDGYVKCAKMVYRGTTTTTTITSTSTTMSRSNNSSCSSTSSTSSWSCPLGTSQTLLTCMACAAVLDRHAVAECAMLADHHTALDERWLESLLLPRREQVLLAYKLALYIRRRNESSYLDSVLAHMGSGVNHADYFGARYASTSQRCEQLTAAIVKQAEKRRALKINEVDAARRMYESLLAQAELLTCECRVGQHQQQQQQQRAGPSAGGPGGWSFSSCVKCELVKRASEMKVDVYEWPLPAHEDERLAVVFELCAPPSVALLRDCLYLLRVDMLDMHTDTVSTTGSDGTPSVAVGGIGTWLKTAGLAEYVEATRPVQRYVTLATETKSFAKSHYSSLHPVAHIDQFLPPNGYTVIFHRKC